MKKFNSLNSFISLLVIYCLLLNFSSQLALSQTETTDTPTPTPTPAAPVNEELQKLKDRNAILEEQKKAAELEKAISDTKFPKPTTTPLAGDTTIEGVKIESEMMAYRALKSAAGKIAEEVKDTTVDKKVAILNDQWLMGIRDYWAVKNKLTLMRDSYKKVLEQPTPQPIKAPTLETGIIASIQNGEDNTTVAINKDKKLVIKTMSKMNISGLLTDDALTEVPKTNKFTSTVGAIASGFGVVGSLVGAAVDLMALARTDTKVTGFAFTVQESALVSEVYRNLGKSTRYYPAEFSPNLNLQRTFAVVTDIQGVSDFKDKAEVLITNIDETEKVYQGAIAEKSSLEAKQKQLPLDIETLAGKIKKLDEIKPKDKTDEIKNKIADLNDKLDDLKLEKEVGLPKKIKKNEETIAKLELKLSQLYAQIKPIAPSGAVVNAFIEMAKNLDSTGKDVMGRTYTFDEIEKLANNDKDAKKTLTGIAEEFKKSNGKTLTAEDRYRLLKPYDLDRLNIFVKIGKYIGSNEIKVLSKLETERFLSDFEQLNLLYTDDTDFLYNKSALAKDRGVNIIKLKSLNKQFDKFFEDVVKSDNLGINPITRLLQTENMMSAFGCNMTSGECPSAYALVLKVIDAGGNNKVKKNLLTMAIKGDDISHSGGAIVEYKLYNMNGQVFTSSVCMAYEAYRKAKNILNDKVVTNVACTPTAQNDNDDKEDESKLSNKKKDKSAKMNLVKN